jgi:alpha-galactosidase
MSQTVVCKDKKRALSVFYFALNNDNNDRLMKVYGLDHERRYRVLETRDVYSGAVLRYAGLPLKKTKSDFVAYLRTFEAVEEN